MKPVITIYNDGSYQLNKEESVHIMGVFIALETIAKKEDKQVFVPLSLGLALGFPGLQKAICDRIDSLAKEE